MAIVKGNYTKSRAKIKAHLRYLTHRPNRSGEKSARALFNYEGLIGRQRAYQLLDEAPRGTYFFRLVISPDPRLEDCKRDLNLQAITKQSLLRFEKLRGRRIQFIAVEHNDHSPHRHSYAIALIQLKKHERISAKDYQAIRETATRAARFERRLLDLKQRYQEERRFRQQVMDMARGKPKRKNKYQSQRQPQYNLPERVLRPPCPDCGYTRVMYTLKSGHFWCQTCHLKLNQQRLRVNQLDLSL